MDRQRCRGGCGRIIPYHIPQYWHLWNGTYCNDCWKRVEKWCEGLEKRIQEQNSRK